MVLPLDPHLHLQLPDAFCQLAHALAHQFQIPLPAHMVDGPPQLPDAAYSQILGLAQVIRDLRVRRSALALCLLKTDPGQFDQGLDHGQGVSRGVVDLLGDAVSLLLNSQLLPGQG